MRIAILCAGVTAVGGCVSVIKLERLDEAHADYAGQWLAADGTIVQVWSNGRGDYVSNRNSVNGATHIEGDKLSIKEGLLGPTFTITAQPHRADGNWVMSLDGVRFTRSGPPVEMPQRLRWMPPNPDDRTATGSRQLDDRVVALNRSGSAKQAAGDFDGAIAEFTNAIAIDPSIALLHYNRGNAQLAKGDAGKAIADFSRAIELDAKFANAHYNRGVARLAKGDLAGADADFTSAIAIEPKKIEAIVGRAGVKLMKRDMKAAIADCDAALKLDARRQQALLIRGNARAASGDLEGGIDDLTRAIAIDPNYAEAYGSRAVARTYQKRHDDARSDFDKCIALRPDMRTELERTIETIKKQSVGK